MTNPKEGLPEGAKRLIRECDTEEPKPLQGGDLNVAKVLAARGYLELLSGCTTTFVPTEQGRRTARLGL